MPKNHPTPEVEEEPNAVCSYCEGVGEFIVVDDNEGVQVVPCPKCGGTMKKNNIKDNCHRWCYADRNGV